MSESKFNIHILGGGGQLGKSCYDILVQDTRFSVHSHNRESCDISKRTDLEALFENEMDFCINCAAYTKVDAAEENSDDAYSVNANAVEYLATLCAVHNVTLIHFSSDYVYHTDTAVPIKETTPCNPQSVYAKSKLAGEVHIQNNLEKHIILRTSWLYADSGHNFVNTMLRLGNDRNELKIVDDQLGSPTYCPDLASTVSQILSSLLKDSDNQKFGIYNYANAGETTWCDFAKQIFRIAQQNVDCIPITSEEFGAPAPRPPYSVLDMGKINRVFGIESRHWKEALAECMANKEES